MSAPPVAEGAAAVAAPTVAEAGGLAGSHGRRQRSAVNDASVITGAAYVAQIINFFAGIVQKGLLGPIGTGFWALMQSFWSLSKVAQLGAFDGTGRQVPFHRGREDYAAAAAVADTGYTFSLIAMAVLGVLMATFALAFGDGWAPEIQYGIMLLGATGPLRMLADAHLVLLHATRAFRPASLALILQAVVALTLQTALVAAFGFYGMFMGAVAAALGSLALYWRMGLTGVGRPAFRWRIDRSRVRELIAYGLPFMVFSQVWLLFMSIDNLIIAGFISVEALGYYALAVSVTTYILHLPRSIGQALFPRMAEAFGRTGEIASFARYAVDAQRLLGYMLVPILVGGAFYFFPVIIRHALPEFEPAIGVVHIMVAGSFVMALCNLPIKAMLTAGRRKALILLVLGCLAVNASANYVAVAVLDEGIEGAAVATVFSYFVVFVATSGYALSMMLGRRTMALHVGELVLVAIYVAGAVWSVESLLGSGAGPLIGDTLAATGKFALFLVLITPWLWRAQVRVQALTRVRDAALKVIAKARRR